MDPASSVGHAATAGPQPIGGRSNRGSPVAATPRGSVNIDLSVGLVFAVLGLVGIVLAVFLKEADENYWDNVGELWSMAAIVAAVLTLVPSLRSVVDLDDKLAWRLGAVGAVFLVFWWVVFVLPTMDSARSSKTCPSSPRSPLRWRRSPSGRVRAIRITRRKRRAVVNDRRPLLVAVAAAVLMLGRPIAGDALGMELDERVLIVAALVLIALAAAARTAAAGTIVAGGGDRRVGCDGSPADRPRSRRPGRCCWCSPSAALLWQRRVLAST